MEIEAVCLDLEGTLFHCSALKKEHISRVLELISRKMAITIKEAEKYLKSKREMSAKKLGYSPPLTTLIETFGISRQGFYDEVNKVDPAVYLKLDIKLQRTLNALKRKGLKLALLTNVSREYTARILKVLGIDVNIFNCIITGSDVVHVKPDMEPFYKVIKALNVNPQQVLFVGDRMIDLAPPRKLGAPTALISPHSDVHLCKSVDFVLCQVYDLASKFDEMINEL